MVFPQIVVYAAVDPRSREVPEHVLPSGVLRNLNFAYPAPDDIIPVWLLVVLCIVLPALVVVAWPLMERFGLKRHDSNSLMLHDMVR